MSISVWRDRTGFNPLPSQEGRRNSPILLGIIRCFNPLPSQEGRRNSPILLGIIRCFNPLPSQEGRPRGGSALSIIYNVSIHSLRKKGDRYAQVYGWLSGCFNPLPSQEGRRQLAGLESTTVVFQSTPFARRETIATLWVIRKTMFQSTPFARRETPSKSPAHQQNSCFNPLPSQEGRPRPPAAEFNLRYVSIHSLRKKGDFGACGSAHSTLTFQSTPFARRETYTGL